MVTGIKLDFGFSLRFRFIFYLTLITWYQIEVLFLTPSQTKQQLGTTHQWSQSETVRRRCVLEEFDKVQYPNCLHYRNTVCPHLCSPGHLCLLVGTKRYPGSGPIEGNPDFTSDRVGRTLRKGRVMETRCSKVRLNSDQSNIYRGPFL